MDGRSNLRGQLLMNAKVTINSPLTAERSPNSLLNMTGPCRLGAADLTQKPETSCHDDEEGDEEG